MALGGRPKEEGGHRPTKHSLNVETIKAIKEYAERYRKSMSRIVEDAIELMSKERDPKKRRQLLKLYVRKQYETFDDFMKKRQRIFFENFNESSRNEAIALWLYEAVDGLLHCFKIVWNMKEREEDPRFCEYAERYLEADLERHVDFLREGFMWIGKNGSKDLLRHLKKLYRDNSDLFENLRMISIMLVGMDEEKELYDEYEKLDRIEAKKRDIKTVEWGKG